MSCATKLKVLADETRLSVLRVLLSGPRHVGELTDQLGIQQSLMSHHLRVLRDAGLVESHRDGKAVLYQIASGVKPMRARKSLDLGCCRLVFPPISTPH